MHDFGKPWWGMVCIPCVTNFRALYAWVVRLHVTGMLSLAQHWHGRLALPIMSRSHIHVICLQHLARAYREQSKLISVLHINHKIQMPWCLLGFVHHDYWFHVFDQHTPLCNYKHLHYTHQWYSTRYSVIVVIFKWYQSGPKNKRLSLQCW